MIIDKQLYEHLNIKSSEILNRFNDFISQFKIEDKKEFLYDDVKNIIKINYIISNYTSLKDNNIYLR
jgi:hypothetical protein